MATVTPLTQPEEAKPSEIQIEIQNLIEGRRKIQNLIAELNKQRADAELAFLRASSRDLAGLKAEFDRSFVDGVFNKYTSVKHADDQTKQRITALGEIANKIGKRINHFKQSNREDLIPILKRDLDKLMLAHTVQEKGGDLLDKEIDRLQKEICELEGAEQDKVPPSRAETAPHPPKWKT